LTEVRGDFDAGGRRKAGEQLLECRRAIDVTLLMEIVALNVRTLFGCFTASPNPEKINVVANTNRKSELLDG
jgi:hypothetical protein